MKIAALGAVAVFATVAIAHVKVAPGFAESGAARAPAPRFGASGPFVVPVLPAAPVLFAAAAPAVVAIPVAEAVPAAFAALAAIAPVAIEAAIVAAAAGGCGAAVLFYTARVLR